MLFRTDFLCQHDSEIALHWFKHGASNPLDYQMFTDLQPVVFIGIVWDQWQHLIIKGKQAPNPSLQSGGNRCLMPILATVDFKCEYKVVGHISKYI